jgi:hypothetical protein
MTPEDFFKKNMHWIALVLFLLFCIKSVQSCNRNMNLTAIQKEYKYTVDSLNTKYNKLNTDYNNLEFELKLQSAKAGEANKRAESIQSVAEKIRANTTINVKGAVSDTIKRK